MKTAISNIIFMSLLVTNDAFMRPAFKILLTQKDYAQFLQYDLDLPNMKEFTFCSWIKPFSLELDQSIFAYNVNGNRLLRFWLESGGMMLKLAIYGNIIFNYPVKIKERSWNHLCLTYQSSYGLWAVYLDEEFLSCGASEDTVNFTIPGGGSIIVGHGIDEKGIPNGFEGEIYGVNMIVKTKNQPLFKNNLRFGVEKKKYIVLKDMKKQPHLIVKNPTTHKQTKRFKTFTAKEKYLSEKDSYDFSKQSSFEVSSKEIVNSNFWSQIHKADQKGKFKKGVTEAIISASGTQELPTISIFETPPPFEPSPFPKYDIQIDVPFKQLSTTMTPPMNPLHTTDYKNVIKDTFSSKEEVFSAEIMSSSPKPTDFATPPQTSDYPKVYGQWSNVDFARRVLGYLKHMKLQKRQEQHVPPTIPLKKVSDSLPYASNLRKAIHPLYNNKRNLKLVKRNADKTKIINLVLSLDTNDVKQQLAETKPRHVEITNRGYTDNSHQTEQWHRNIRGLPIVKLTSKDVSRFEPINHVHVDSKDNNQYESVVPFLKSLEYFVEKPTTEKFHNVKPYKTDYTPREINMELINNDKKLHENIFNQNRIRIKSEDFLPQSLESSPQIPQIVQNLSDSTNVDTINIGNPLNEWYVMGLSLEGKRKLEQKKYHRDYDDNFDYIEKIPPSLLPIACANMNMLQNNNQLLPYIQQDINYEGTEFIALNFNKCLEENDFPSLFDDLLLINWEITPVRLFGGATPVKTVLCFLS